MIDLQEQANRATDERSFIQFLLSLAEDREAEIVKESENPSSPYGIGANGWENVTIEAFLGAAAAWGESSANGLPLYDAPANPWTRCAHILLMGKLYE
jgi:hypothetical protein